VSEWWTYTLGDFLMFSPTTYWRLVENYNRDVWPAQLVGLMAGTVALALTLSRREDAARLQAVLLAAAFVWVGWAFHWQRYATINWAARYLALAFWAQAVLFLVLALLPAKDSVEPNGAFQKIGWFLAMAGLVLYPLGSAWDGKVWSQIEVFGVSPEPTALLGLGLVLARPLSVQPLFRWALGLIPTVSLLVGAATFRAMARA
jgi:Family of unknown function (DUF6064)